MNVARILEKMDKLPNEFEQAYRDGKWCMAAMAYENAVLMSNFIELDDAERKEFLLGFDQAEVEAAYKAAGWYKEEQDAHGEGNRKEAV